MRERLAQARPYSLAILRRGARYDEPGARAIIWEHGRRNFELRAQNLLCVVCPMTDDGDIRGIGIFACDADKTCELMESDPAVRANVLTFLETRFSERSSSSAGFLEPS